GRLVVPVWLALGAMLRLAVAEETSAAGAWTTRVWQSDDGLPNNHVTGIVQTPDGYLWVATYSGLVRFDGVHFDEYLPRDLGIGSNQKISALALNGLWLGALHGGVVRLDAQRVELFSDGLPYKHTLRVLEDGDGALWLTHQGGTVYRVRDGRVTAFDATSGLPSADTPARYACALELDTQGRLWFAKDGHVGIFRAE